jgi:signal peptidase II
MRKWSILLCTTLVLVDVVSKVWVTEQNWGYIRNTGGSLSLFRDQSWFLTLNISILVLVTIFYINLLVARAKSRYEIMGVACIEGGAVANLLDRFVHGAVTDFVSIWKFPVFNFADIAICLGVVILGWGIIKSQKHG